MKMTHIGMLFVLALGSSIGCETQKEHETKYCSALTAMNEDVRKLSAIGPSSTIDELRTQIANLSRDSRTAEKHGRKIGTNTAKQFTQSVNQLDVDSRTLSGSMTVAQAQGRLMTDVQNVTQTAQTLASESGCPEAMPRGINGPGTPASQGSASPAG